VSERHAKALLASGVEQESEVHGEKVGSQPSRRTQRHLVRQPAHHLVRLSLPRHGVQQRHRTGHVALHGNHPRG
jgi:hypothetical protein